MEMPVSGADRDRGAGTGLGVRLSQIQDWLDQNAGADGWATAPSGFQAVVNDAMAINFADVTTATSFRRAVVPVEAVEVVNGLFRVREDEPAPRMPAAHHKTPEPWPTIFAINPRIHLDGRDYSVHQPIVKIPHAAPSHEES
jgi:hypothetical protein